MGVYSGVGGWEKLRAGDRGAEVLRKNSWRKADAMKRELRDQEAEM